MKVSKDAHVQFQVKCVGNVYMLRNSEVPVGELQLSLTSRLVVVEQLKIVPKEILGLGGADTQQGSPDQYSSGGAKSNKFYMDLGEY